MTVFRDDTKGGMVWPVEPGTVGRRVALGVLDVFEGRVCGCCRGEVAVSAMEHGKFARFIVWLSQGHERLGDVLCDDPYAECTASCIIAELKFLAGVRLLWRCQSSHVRVGFEDRQRYDVGSISQNKRTTQVNVL